MRKILESCPTCGGPLAITEVRCERCATQVRSQYQPCPFCRLSPEQMNFALLFVQNRGNLSDLEKALGVSYPTIRGKLEEIIRLVTAAPATAAPGAPAPGPGLLGRLSAEAERRREILAQVAGGQLGAAEGLAALRSLQRDAVAKPALSGAEALPQADAATKSPDTGREVKR